MADDVAVLTELNEQFIEAVRRGSWEMLAPLLSPGFFFLNGATGEVVEREPYRQMIERIASLLGRTPKIVEVPVLTPYLSSLWLNLVTPVNASVARPLVEGLRNPTIAREERIRTLLPFQLTSFEEAARRALP